MKGLIESNKSLEEIIKEVTIDNSKTAQSMIPDEHFKLNYKSGFKAFFNKVIEDNFSGLSDDQKSKVLSKMWEEWRRIKKKGLSYKHTAELLIHRIRDEIKEL